MSRYLITRFDGTFESQRHRVRFGSLGVRGDRWDVRCWSSGAVVGGSVRGARMVVSGGSPMRAHLDIESKDGRFRAALTVLASERSLQRRLEAAGAFATELHERRQLADQGEWWLDPRAFLELGEAAAVSVPDTRYLGGWVGKVRFERRAGGRVLDFDESGVTLRGMRRHLQIPWEEVRAITVDDAGGSSVGLRVRTDEGDVRFESRQSTSADLRRRLSPLARRLQRATPMGRDN